MNKRYSRPIVLLPLFRERIWGKNTLAPYFNVPAAKGPIGEVWFTYEDNLTSLDLPLGVLLRQAPEILGNAADPAHPGVCPLLVKLLFTTERLSVQVHPGDDYAALHHQSLGKTEAWYIMASEPPGEVAVGFRTAITPEKLEESALSGEIESLLDWRKVQSGDVVFTPAGTVHAIGAGLTVCEIQENSDITYRLYDYGRPRELHLEHGAKVSHLGVHTHNPDFKPVAPGRVELLSCSYFRIEKLQASQPISLPGAPYYQIVICVNGEGSLDDLAVRAGQAFLLPADADSVTITGGEWILTYRPEAAK